MSRRLISSAASIVILILIPGAALALAACSSNEANNSVDADGNFTTDMNAVVDINATDMNAVADMNASDMNVDTNSVAWPSTGIFQTFTDRPRLAPLTISTPAGDEAYFVKLVDSQTNARLMTLFIPGGATFETKVPLGSIQIRYAVGTDWFGPEQLFGPDTGYFVADKTFEFTAEGDVYRGYTVELIRQVGGNLDAQSTTANDF